MRNTTYYVTINIKDKKKKARLRELNVAQGMR